MQMNIKKKIPSLFLTVSDSGYSFNTGIGLAQEDISNSYTLTTEKLFNTSCVISQWQILGCCYVL